MRLLNASRYVCPRRKKPSQHALRYCELPTDTMPGTTPARELASSAVMSFCMNNIAVEIALATPLIERVTGTTPDHTQLLLTFIFINLCFFFGPFYGKASGGACNNPTVYFLFWLLGEIPGGAAAVGFVCTIVGTAIGTVGYGLLLDALPMAGYTGITAVKAAAGPVHGALAEAAVAFTNFLFAGLIQPMFGDVMAPYAGAFFYVLTVMVERCEYSCGFMNPAVVLATHAWDGDLGSTASMTECATYFVGAMGGAAAGAGVSALAKPRKATSGEKKKEL